MPLPKLSPDRRFVFVLWGERFDEIATITLCGILRQRGLRVYIVGLDGLAAVGQYRIMINADRTLGQTLSAATQARCVIAACDTAAFLRAENDPRVRTFVAEAAENNVCIVLQSDEVLTHSSLRELKIEPNQLFFYGDYDLYHFINNLADFLLISDTGV